MEARRESLLLQVKMRAARRAPAPLRGALSPDVIARSPDDWLQEVHVRAQVLDRVPGEPVHRHLPRRWLHAGSRVPHVPDGLLVTAVEVDHRKDVGVAEVYGGAPLRLGELRRGEADRRFDFDAERDSSRVASKSYPSS